jgi:hypothetical protein
LRLQEAGDIVIKAKQLRLVAGAYLSGMGYYEEILPEMPSTDVKPDVIGVKPKLRDVKLRLERGGAPAGILYLFKDSEWIPTKSTVERSGFDEDFVMAVLCDSEADGWVESKNE